MPASRFILILLIGLLADAVPAGTNPIPALSISEPKSTASSESIPLAVLFAAPDCEECRNIKEWWQDNTALTGTVRLAVLNIEKTASFSLLVNLEKSLQVNEKNASFPALCLGGRLIYGMDSIMARLPELIASERNRPSALPVLTPVAQAIEASGDLILTVELPEPDATAIPPPLVPATAWPASWPIAVFYLPGCRKCSRLEAAVQQAEKSIPGLSVSRFDITTPEGRTALELVRQRFHLSGETQAYAPMLVWSDGYTTDFKLDVSAIRKVLKPSAMPPFWLQTAPELAATEQKVHVEFQKMTAGLIAVAGFLDGINPCAFATAVFLISYLVYLGRGRRDVFILGASFCTGVFLSYFLIGLGLFHIVRQLTEYPWIKMTVYGSMALLGFVLGVLHTRDAIRYRRRGSAQDMQMGLSLETTRKIHQYVRKFTGSRFLVPAGLLLGLIISSLELACTGQIYLPTLVLINRLGVTSKSLLALLLYNVAFIFPLLLVTVLAASGVSAKVLAEKARQNIFATKLAMAGLFFVISLVMLAMILGNY